MNLPGVKLFLGVCVGILQVLEEEAQNLSMVIIYGINK